MGSLSRVKCNCSSKEDILMKLAMEKTLIEAEVSLRMFILRCVRWYSTVNVVAIDTQAGRSIRGSSEAPDRYRTYEVSHTIVALVAKSRTRVAGGV